MGAITPHGEPACAGLFCAGVFLQCRCGVARAPKSSCECRADERKSKASQFSDFHQEGKKEHSVPIEKKSEEIGRLVQL
ncbi:hypothetical protein NDU88_005842 [Pleurodeles waltl]|uniref:Uncharacterized protein n=1 Tax=Pleurodeles waltl TaxID=8319 RepID=A0AAV7SN37_PLEWA|nr:hypothetical protein NDU88_005842 [Pleurodeles waltl]